MSVSSLSRVPFVRRVAVVVSLTVGAAVGAPAALGAGALPHGAHVLDGVLVADSVACVSPTRCYYAAATGSGAQQFLGRFNPLGPGVTQGDGHIVERGGELTCLSVSRCVRKQYVGDVIGWQSFDPRSPGTPATHPLGIENYGVPLECPSTSQCTAYDNYRGLVTFDPGASTAPAPFTTSVALSALSCPSTELCVATGSSSSVFVFDPSAPAEGVLTRPTPPGSFRELDCPTTTQCVAISREDRKTFDPRSPASTNIETLRTGSDMYGRLSELACPVARQCVALEYDTPGQLPVALGFDPTTATKPVRTELSIDGVLVCVSARQCTIAGTDGKGHPAEQTFDPTGRSPHAVTARRVHLTPTTKVLVVGAAPKAAVGRTVVTTLTRRFYDDEVVRSTVRRPGRFEAAFGELKPGAYEAISVVGGKTIKRTKITIPKAEQAN
jgi:hypothetical protein